MQKQEQTLKSETMQNTNANNRQRHQRQQNMQHNKWQKNKKLQTQNTTCKLILHLNPFLSAWALMLTINFS